jgi:hypothetical protein
MSPDSLTKGPSSNGTPRPMDIALGLALLGKNINNAIGGLLTFLIPE